MGFGVVLLILILNFKVTFYKLNLFPFNIIFVFKKYIFRLNYDFCNNFSSFLQYFVLVYSINDINLEF